MAAVFSSTVRFLAGLSVALAINPAAAQTASDSVSPFSSQGGVSRGSFLSLLQAVHDLSLSARAAGVVEKFHVEEGARVRAGEPILSLDSDQEKAEVMQAEAQLRGTRAEVTRAVAELERIKQLSAESIYSEKQLLDAQTQAELARSRTEQAEATVMLARARLANRAVLSPIDGVFLKTNKSVGEAVDRFETVARVIDATSLEMVVYCDSQFFSVFQIGHSVDIRVLKTPETQPLVTGKIVHIDPIIDPSSGTFRIKVQLARSEHAAPGFAARLIPPTPRVSQVP